MAVDENAGFPTMYRHVRLFSCITTVKSVILLFDRLRTFSSGSIPKHAIPILSKWLLDKSSDSNPLNSSVE